VTRAPSPDEVLDVRGLSASYGDREVLRGVDFAVRSGEFTGLIGTNGSGKTTLFRVILGLMDADRGQVRIAGGRTSVGYVPQRVSFDPDLPVRVRDLVALGLDGHRFGIPLRSTRRASITDEVMDAVGVAHLAERRVGELSGGELQRALVAHALVSGPRLLLLDEPLANLDPGSVQGVVELLDRVAHERGVAVLLSAHEMNALLPVMDRVVYIAAGRAASGTTEEVVRADVLSALYGHHVDVVRLHGRVLVVAGEEGERRGEHDEVVIE
jgi:zinc/manganese transport system ATP-binding protein